jgi:hypothetical protein
LWFLEWPWTVHDRTLCYVKARHVPSLVSINLLEYATQLIMMLGCHLHHLKNKDSRDDQHPIYLLECDNTAGKSWLTKGCTLSATGRDLAHFQASLLFDQGAGYRFCLVNTKSNVIADKILCIPSESSLPHKFPLLLTQAPSLLDCRHFLPHATLISLIVEILLQTGCTDPLTASRQLLIAPRRFTSSPSATT